MALSPSVRFCRSSSKHPVRQAHCLHFLLHVHLCVNLRGRDAAMPQYLADRVEFRTSCLCLDTAHVLRHVIRLLHQRKDMT